MSHQVSQSSLVQKESTESDAGTMKMMTNLDVEEAKAPEIVIKASDLEKVQKATHLSRTAAIELIQNANGDIKQALRNFVKE